MGTVPKEPVEADLGPQPGTPAWDPSHHAVRYSDNCLFRHFLGKWLCPRGELPHDVYGTKIVDEADDLLPPQPLQWEPRSTVCRTALSNCGYSHLNNIT